MSTKTDKTMIQVKVKTRERLIAYGGKGQTYDEIINQLLDRQEEGETL
jgi:hypothetical protein